MSANSLNFPFQHHDARLFATDAAGVKARDQIVREWLGTVAKQHGLDNGKAAYEPQILEYARQIAKTVDGHHMGPALGGHIINELSEAVKTQLTLANKLEDIAYPDRHTKRFDAASAYAHTRSIRNIPSFFEFLSAPYSEASAAKFTTQQAGFPQDRSEAKRFYAFFWALQAEERTAYFSHVLGVGSGEDDHFKEKLKSDSKALAETFLPAEKKDSNAKLYGERFAKTVAESMTQEELAFLFSHLLHAVHQDQTQPPSDDPDIRFGHRLTAFLVAIGGAKIAQGAHSFSQTVEKWRVGLANSKAQANPMRRAAFLSKAASLPGDITGGIKRIGEALGTGTYIDTKAVEFTDAYLAANPAMAEQQAGKGLVLQLLKEDSGEMSDRIFELVIRTMKDLSETDWEAEKSFGGLIPVIQHKAKMIREETDLNTVAAKARISESLVEGVKIKIKSLTAVFAASGVFKHGEEFKVSRRIHGTHFNKLPEGTKKEKDLKAAVAEAIFTAELFTIFSGKPFNHDQHGDNQAITIDISPKGKITVYIGNFDDGAIIAEPPTETQKKLFADIIMDSMANSTINGFNPFSSLKHTFARAQKIAAEEQRAESEGDVDAEFEATFGKAFDAVSMGMGMFAPEERAPEPAKTSAQYSEDDLSYVNAMVEAVVSLGDYTKYMDTKSIIRSMRAVCSAHKVDSVVADRLGARLASIDTISKGGHDAAEEERRSRYYPPPNDVDRQFTSATNRILGATLLKLGPLCLSTPALSLVFGKSEIIMPAGYDARRFEFN